MSKGRSVAETYHHLTKYREEILRAGGTPDWTRPPSQFKDIVGSRRLSLRSYLPSAEAEGEGEEKPPMGLACLGRLLFYSYGVTGVIRYQGGHSQLLRASPSAGALYPTEVYVALRAMPGVEAGIYNYQVRSHELVLLWEGDLMASLAHACGGDPDFGEAHACVILTGVHWRSAWRYKERGYRRVLMDTGHVLANLAAYAPHEDCRTKAVAGFCDPELNGLFFLDDAVEAALLCVPLMRGAGEQAAAPLWASPVGGPARLQASALREEADFSESASLALHRASNCLEPSVVAEPPPRADPAASEAIPLPDPGSLPEAIPDAIVQRRSARGYTGESMSRTDLGRALAFAFGRGPGDARFARYPVREAGLLRAHVIVHNVEGLAPGLYRVEGAGEALVPVARGDHRETLYRVALGQEIARRCCAALAFSAPARGSIERYGERAYRYLHLEAGTIGESFQLAAGALGAGACGIGGFLDDEAAAMLGVDPADFVLYFVTIGRT